MPKGFTLIEISIVIVIIGLITAGITTAAALTRNARINSQVMVFKKYEVAYKTFKTTYEAVPGDMANARNYWPASINGDGNGRISNGGDILDDGTEAYILFDHLSRSGLIKEQYDANLTGLNISIPSLKIDRNKGMYAANNSAQLFPAIQQLSVGQGRKLYVAGLHLELSYPNNVNSNSRNDDIGVANAATMRSIDIKIDDGTARTGKFRSMRVIQVDPLISGPMGNCLDATDGDYLLTNDELACVAEYILEQ